MIILKEGDKVLDFIGIDQNENIIFLFDYKGKKFILFFYFKDNMFGCMVEVCNLCDNFEDFKVKGYVLLGVSLDSVKKY